MKITSSDPKYYLGRSGKGLIISLFLKTIVRSKKNKKARYAITYVIVKCLPNSIKEFKRFPYNGFIHKRLKHEPTDSYFYLAIQLAKGMMRADAFNYHVDPVRTEMTGIQQIPIFHLCNSGEKKSKGIIAKKTYHKSVLRTIVNQKALSSMEILQMITVLYIRGPNMNPLTVTFI